MVEEEEKHRAARARISLAICHTPQSHLTCRRAAQLIRSRIISRATCMVCDHNASHKLINRAHRPRPRRHNNTCNHVRGGFTSPSYIDHHSTCILTCLPSFVERTNRRGHGPCACGHEHANRRHFNARIQVQPTRNIRLGCIIRGAQPAPLPTSTRLDLPGSLTSTLTRLWYTDSSIRL